MRVWRLRGANGGLPVRCDRPAGRDDGRSGWAHPAQHDVHPWVGRRTPGGASQPGPAPGLAARVRTGGPEPGVSYHSWCKTTTQPLGVGFMRVVVAVAQMGRNCPSCPPKHQPFGGSIRISSQKVLHALRYAAFSSCGHPSSTSNVQRPTSNVKLPVGPEGLEPPTKRL